MWEINDVNWSGVKLCASCHYYFLVTVDHGHVSERTRDVLVTLVAPFINLDAISAAPHHM